MLTYFELGRQGPAGRRSRLSPPPPSPQRPRPATESSSSFRSAPYDTGLGLNYTDLSESTKTETNDDHVIVIGRFISLSLSLYLSVCLSVSLCIYIFFFSLSLSLYIFGTNVSIVPGHAWTVVSRSPSPSLSLIFCSRAESLLFTCSLPPMTVYAGLFTFILIHRTLTGTKGALTCACDMLL